MQTKPVFLASFFVCLLFFISFGFVSSSVYAVTPVYCDWDDHSGNPLCTYTGYWYPSGPNYYNVPGDASTVTTEQLDAYGTVGVAAELISFTNIAVNYAAGAMDWYGGFCTEGSNCNVYDIEVWCDGVRKVNEDPCFLYCSNHMDSTTCSISSKGTYEIKAYASVNTKDSVGNNVPRTNMKSTTTLDIGCIKNSDCGSNQECVIASNKVRTYCKDLPCDNSPACSYGAKRTCTTSKNYKKYLGSTACYGGCTWTYDALYSCGTGNYCSGTKYDAKPCYSCSTACDGVCQSSACSGTDPDCSSTGNLQSCCGNNACDGSETYSICSTDCKKPNGISCTANTQCTSGNCVHNVCRATNPYCGDGYCDSGETYSSCLTDCKKPNSISCTANTQCTSGNCVHGICRASSTYCGDGYCDSGETDSSCSSDCYANIDAISIISSPSTAISDDLVPITVRFKNTGTYTGSTNAELSILPISWSMTSTEYSTQTSNYISECCPGNTYYDAVHISLGVGVSQDIIFYPKAPNPSSIDSCDFVAPIRTAWGSSHNIFAGTYPVCGSGYTSQTIQKSITINSCGNNVCDGSETYSTCSNDCTKDNGNVCSVNTECTSGNCVHGTCRATTTYCGDGYCDTGETDNSCSSDCYSNIEMVNIVNAPTTAISDTLVPITVQFKNTGTYSGKISAEVGIIPNIWTSYSTEYSTQTLIERGGECCSGNTYYDALNLTLEAGKTVNVDFFPKAPNPSKVDACDDINTPNRSAWGTSHKIVGGIYPECGGGYVSWFPSELITINSCGNNVCDYGETYSTCSNDCTKDNGDVCSVNAECNSGYCVHELCRATSTYCGDTYCDVGETYTSCSTDCPGCHAILYTTVLDQYSNPLSGYNVYSDSGYDGVTDSLGKKRSDVYLDSCYVFTDITVKYSDNNICDTKSTYINWDNDDDYLTFTCTVEKPNLYVNLYLDKSAYYLFDSIKLTAKIRDVNGNSINAQTAIYDPYLFTTTLPTYTSQYTYDGQIKSTGCYDFIVSATNPNYNSVNQKITICSSDYSGKIRVFVKETGTNIALSDVLVYDSTIYKGTTNTLGNFDYSATRGSHTVNAYCPSTTDLCASEIVNIDYNGEIETINLECDCTKDSDGDGYTDDDELLMGTDPYEFYSNFDSVVAGHTFDIDNFDSCITLKLSILTAKLTTEQKENLKETLASFDAQYTGLNYETEGINIITAQTIKVLNIEKNQIIDKQKTLKQAIDESDEVDYLVTEHGVFFILTNTTTYETTLFEVSPYCSGLALGVVYGAGQGVLDDLEFGKAILYAIIHILDTIKTIYELLDDIGRFLINLFSSGLSPLFQTLGDAFHEMIVSIFNKGQNINTWNSNTVEYTQFQLGYFHGYFTGYITEQTLFLGKVAEAFKGFKAGAKLGEVSSKVIKSAGKIAETYGTVISSAMKKSELGLKILDTGTDLAQDGYALLVKTMKLPGETYAKATERVDAFLKPAKLGADAVAERVGRLKNVFGFSDDVVAKLSNSKIGKKALAEWSESEVKGLGKIADDVGDINFIDNQLADGRFKVGGGYTPKRTAELYDGMTTKWSKEDIKNLIKTQDTAIDDVNSLFGRELTSEEYKFYNSIASKDSLESLKNIESEDGLKRILKEFGEQNKDKSIGGAGNVDILTNNVALDHTFKETFSTVDNLGFKISDKITQKFSSVSSEFVSRKKTVVIDILESSATEIQIKESVLKAANTLHENVFLWDEIYYVFIRNGNGGKLTKYVIKNGEIIG